MSCAGTWGVRQNGHSVVTGIEQTVTRWYGDIGPGM